MNPSALALRMGWLVAGLAVLGMGPLPSWGAEPRRANHDEAKVTAFTLPDCLQLQNGSPVTTPDRWFGERRPELLRLFEQNVYGRFPRAPRVSRWRVTREDAEAVGGIATRRDVVLELPEPGSELPTTIALRFTVYTPKVRSGPVPGFVGIHLFDTAKAFPSPAVARNPPTGKISKDLGGAVGRDILNRGYALASLDIQELAPDSATNYARGALRLLGELGPEGRDPQTSGALGVWAWGLVRALDYFSTTHDIDPSAVIAIGHSRMGKAALWAGANDARFAALIANGSGCGGAALSKRDFGETVGIITHAFPHWFCGTFATFSDEEERLPVDQHQLLALLAPRPVYLAGAEKDGWADPRGEYLSAVHAAPVFRLLGAPGIPSLQYPGLDQPIGTRVRFHLRRGGHDLTEYDWARFLEFADDEVRHPAIARRLASRRRLDASEALRQTDGWFQSASASVLAANVLSHQSPRGSWPKNTNTTTNPFRGKPSELHGTFDNGATLEELRFLARFQRIHGNAGFEPERITVLEAKGTTEVETPPAAGARTPAATEGQLTGSPDARAAVQRGLRHILEAQYPTGGWPQSYPPGPGYARHITFNDDTFVRILDFLREAPRDPDFAFLGPELLESCRVAVDRGIDCILRCQVRIEGTKTVWCAQHDSTTLEPRPARTFEPVSLSGAESARVLKFLMSLNSNRAEIEEAIRGGVAWFERSALHGIRVVRSNGDVSVVSDPSAPAIWARFYDLETGRPIFTGRDGVVRQNLAEIEKERRTGYSWYGTWGRDVAEAFLRWKRAHP